MADGTVNIDVQNSIAQVEFSHPKGNSLPGKVLQRLADTILQAGNDPAVRVIVLRSAGSGAFCGGASFDELKAISSPESGQEFFMGFAKVILAMKECPKFIISRVQGKVVGGGAGLVAASDYALAVESASVKLSELALGLGPFVIGPCVERRVGPANFSAMAIDADWRDAKWAHAAGLYTKLFQSIENLDSELSKLTANFAKYNPQAVARLKAVFWEGTEHWDVLLKSRAAASGTLALSEFTKRAVGGS